MLKRPRLKAHFRIEIVEEDGVFLLSERGSILLSNRLYKLLFPLLDGNHTPDDITEKLVDELPASYVYYALMNMEQKGYLVESQAVLPQNLAIFCEYLNILPENAYRRLQETPVSVTALGSLSTLELIAGLESLHIQVAETGNLEIILTNDYLQPELLEINQKKPRAIAPLDINQAYRNLNLARTNLSTWKNWVLGMSSPATAH
jgi:hypothetical protein